MKPQRTNRKGALQHQIVSEILPYYADITGMYIIFGSKKQAGNISTIFIQRKRYTLMVSSINYKHHCFKRLPLRVGNPDLPYCLYLRKGCIMNCLSGESISVKRFSQISCWQCKLPMFDDFNRWSTAIATILHNFVQNTKGVATFKTLDFMSKHG